MASSQLTSQQAHALFDILTHHETYAEIEKFKFPGAIKDYGPPFTDDPTSTSPILQLLLSRFALKLPGLRDVSQDFWRKRCQAIVDQFGKAGLSESYEKGEIGSRKTLATAFSVLLEYPARGCLGGFPKHDGPKAGQKYDRSKSEDVMKAWDDFVQGFVHGDMIDALFDKAAESDKLSDHPSVVQGAHEYVLVNLAAFLHYTLILSPDGRYILTIMENLHKLIPYSLIRPTLKVGNAATMINGMMRLLLAKLSVNTITSWIGISKPSDEGMNLLQQILNTIVGWDIAESQKRSANIEKSKDKPPKEHLDSIRKHVANTREEHDRIRSISQKESKSIVTAIFESASISDKLSEPQHTQALQYLDVYLSIRDREEIVKILCRQQPDLLTQAIRDAVAAYDPVIRGVHQAVDLSATLTDYENFMNDLIKVAKPPVLPRRKSWNSNGPNDAAEAKLPSVEDFVQLLKKHQGASHRFLHQVAKNGPEITQWYRDYAREAVSQFRNPILSSGGDGSKDSSTGAGQAAPHLDKLVTLLSPKDREEVLNTLDKHSAYLSNLDKSSKARMRSILNNDSATPFGPGIYLARWEHLLDQTLLTPTTPTGAIRQGRASMSEGITEDARKISEKQGEGKVIKAKAPDASEVMRLLGPGFRKILEGSGTPVAAEDVD